jgi:hypothetical protein
VSVFLIYYSATQARYYTWLELVTPDCFGGDGEYLQIRKVETLRPRLWSKFRRYKIDIEDKYHQ